MASVIFLLVGCSKDEKVEKDGNHLDSVEGVWEGTIQVPEQSLPIIVAFTQEEGMISIPIQGVMDYPLSSVKLKKEEIYFDMNLQGQEITFDGEVKDDMISGSFTQQGQTFPFELTRKEAEAGETVEIDVKGGKFQGHILTPEGEGPFPVMVIHAGSGPTDKDGNSLAMAGKNNSLKMVADYLLENNIATIRYDKRGIGENTKVGGKEEDLRFEDYVDDTAAWLEWAKKDDRFSDLGVIGHSEGSFIGMIAAQKADADIFISLAGPGRPFDEILLEQLAGTLPQNLLKESANIIAELKEGNEVSQVSAELDPIFRASVQPYLQSMLAYNPVEELKKLDAKVMIINGERDLQVLLKDANLLHEAKPEAELLILEKMNHVLKDAPEDEEGNLKTYTDPDMPLAEGLMDGIVTFLKQE